MSAPTRFKDRTWRHSLSSARRCSVRPRSYSRFLTHEAASLLEVSGAETRIFDLSGLPLPDDAPGTHRKVAKLRKLVDWSEGQGHGGSWALDLIRSSR
jgi:hypothetical protein